MENTYWNRKGRYQVAVDLLRELIPAEGSVAEPKKNKALEKFRIASNCYYDLYNNGLCNRASQFSKVFSIRFSSYREPWRPYGGFNACLYEKTELAMDQIIESAAAEQGLALLTVEML